MLIRGSCLAKVITAHGFTGKALPASGIKRLNIWIQHNEKNQL